MPTWVILPKLGINMTKGVIVNWLVPEGASVQKGQPIVEIETDKAVQEVEAPETGTLARIVARPGDVVPCTYVIAAITRPGEPLPEHIPQQAELGVVPESEFGGSAAGVAAAQPGAPGGEPRRERVPITPAARKLAEELGIDYRTIQGSGPEGRIGREDVLRAAEAARAATTAAPSPPAAPAPGGGVVPVTGVRAVVAQRMADSARQTARVVLIADADATQLVAWRDYLRRDYAQQASNIGYNELLVVIAARALRAFPYMNASWREDGIHILEEINIGVAVDTPRGLLVPVIRHADRKTIFDIHRELSALIEAARAGRSAPDDLSGGTFTITNLGMYEIDAFTPIINLPEAAILGVGQIAPRPVVKGEQVIVQRRVALSLAFDHRVVDGAPAARFLQHVKHLIEAPFMLCTQ